MRNGKAVPAWEGWSSSLEVAKGSNHNKPKPAIGKEGHLGLLMVSKAGVHERQSQPWLYW